MSYICIVKPLNRMNEKYLFSYDFYAAPTTDMIVFCETKFGGMYGVITEWAKMPQKKAEQEKLLAIMKMIDNKITLPLKPVTKIYEVKYGKPTNNNM